jgi:hypothetical protein
MPEEINILLGKNVQLIGFEQLERSELDVVNKILQKYLPRIENQVAYELLKLRLKQHQKGKSFSHEIKADLLIRPGSIVTSSLEYKNLYNGLNLIMRKLLTGVEHKIKKKMTQHPRKRINRRI